MLRQLYDKLKTINLKIFCNSGPWTVFRDAAAKSAIPLHRLRKRKRLYDSTLDIVDQKKRARLVGETAEYRQSISQIVLY